MPNAKNKILIVEDDLELLEVLKKKFAMEKFEVLEAINGKTGLVEAFQHHPDLILLDIVMPVMDGMTMLMKLREDLWGKNVPVVLLTNLSDESKVAEAMTRGVYGYLVKADWNISDVVKKVKQRLNSHLKK